LNAQALDPFDEKKSRRRLTFRTQVLGTPVEFMSNSGELLALARAAFAGVPSRRARRPRRAQRITLMLAKDDATGSGREPPRPAMSSGAGWYCCTMNAGNFVIVSPATRCALVMVSNSMLKFPYHIRYELIEFAAYMLVPRVHGWVPLHAACVGLGRRGVLLLGASGAGKSTLSLHCLTAGLEFLSEDALFVAPRDLRASGVPNFLHLRPTALKFMNGTSIAKRIRGSPVIRRRSGEKKYELDVRAAKLRLAVSPLRIVAVVVASKRAAMGSRLLRPIPAALVWRRLSAEQPQQSRGRAWTQLRHALSAVPGYELRRAAHPDSGALAIASILRASR
jgi:hypothetical protein